MSAKQWLFRIFVGPVDPWYGKTEKTPEIVRPLEIPQPSTNEVIGIPFGTCRITKPQIVWWGDLKILKIKPSGAGKK